MNENTASAQKVAIVTGGASGLGYAIAEKFVNSGIRTIVIGRNEEKLNAAKEAFGALCSTISFDLSNLQGIPELVESIAKEYGQIDILVNNAGINMKKPFTEVTDDEFQRIILTNVNAVFALSREVVKVMLPRKKGAIVNISSMASQYGIPKVIAYTASKSAIEGMTRAMAVDLSPEGIRVNCVAPGFIATDMSAKALNNDPERKNKVLSRTPMGHLGEPADVAEAVHYFASDAAKYVTGTVLTVDGGNSIGF
ncbi:NAD(P)-dependent dehydrogenase (short-subunit alcohol dehydrogenase family) [Pontibacter ummariensis]|uniref:NAD(P)-dependent dehydrogenase, short-chain alcohol dehydrogenase family n=1 Tax=Pontibacter ummariensis TaxID=1610492 RepID=A0A239DLI5_9BACT|nr:SDR family oxidoreductase [Pontibacter ummariensis]PRY13864.1 NAD(P)-dependent dehydrogenase (short-subunit alcohol dehydrogenase family) [Pontibacter ummariensis]SNS33297.1 NAD(P)-dependent dehydrogenase, short-chain alcohol dehydrogenase family [Pontibacter ummariensis]